MFTKLSRRIAQVKPSMTLAITARANELKAEGEDVIGFGAGEPDFPTPEHIREAGKRAIDEGWTRYTAAGGLPVLRRAVAESIDRRYGLDYTPSEVMVTVGGKHALYNLFQCLVDEGDEVIVPAPYWVSYPEQIELAGGVCVTVPAGPEQGFKITPEQLRAAITPKTTILLLNSPSNPTGAAYTAEELRALASVAVEHRLFVISDEIYADLVYDGFEFRSFPTLLPGLRDRVAVVSGWGKTYSMTGWRMGWVAAPEQLIRAMTNLQSQSTSNPAAMCQMAALEATRGSHAFLGEWVRRFDQRRRMFVTGLNAIPGIVCPMPQGAFYVFPDVRGVLDLMWRGAPLGTSLRLAELLLEEARVAVVPGEPFGAPGFIRLSYATGDAQIEEGLRRIAAVLERVRRSSP